MGEMKKRVGVRGVKEGVIGGEVIEMRCVRG